MKVYYDINDFPTLDYSVVTSGTFDGVHLGHKKILSRLTEIARQSNGESVVITYWPHPRMVVSNDSQHLKLLSTIDEKIELLSQNGVDHLLIIPFTREFSEQSSEEFIQNILVKTLATKKLVIGYDHHFGKNREGSFDYLVQNAINYDFEIEEIPRQEVDNLAISSTKIRDSLGLGDVKTAAHLLGRAYYFSGIVSKGRQLGRTLGFPTANIHIAESYKLIPADGVYAVKITVRGQVFGGVMNIGLRPTVEGISRTIEVHIFDFDADIYGEYVSVETIEFIRIEQKFNGLDALKAQILLDCGSAKAFFVE